MQVKIVDGERVIQANARDVKVMREAAGLFSFVLDVMPSTGLEASAIEDVKDLMAACIDGCSGDVEEADQASEEVPAAAGKVT